MVKRTGKPFDPMNMCITINKMVEDEEEAVPAYNRLIDLIEQNGVLTPEIKDIIEGDIIDQEIRHRKKLNQIAVLIGCKTTGEPKEETQ